MSASVKAYEWLQERLPGRYEELVAWVLSGDGAMVLHGDFLLAYGVRDGVLRVEFAYGDLGRIWGCVKAVGALEGVSEVEWERGLVGKHVKMRRYKINDLHLCKTDTI